MSHPNLCGSRRQYGALRREHVLNPITALAFYERLEPQTASVTNAPDANCPRWRYLFAAEDTDLKIYRWTDSSKMREDAKKSHTLESQDREFLGQVTIFKAQSIHGISIHSQPTSDEDDSILVWGGYSVALLSVKCLLRIIEEPSPAVGTGPGFIPVFNAPDWIFDAKVSPFDQSKVVMLTAHNEIVETKVLPSTAKSFAKTLDLHSVRSPSRPILYAGNIMWLDMDCVLVAAGTVFGEVLVWKWHQGREEQPPHEQCEHLFAFSGHEGSIFGIHISPVMSLPGRTGERARLLATCSDDRTVRVWDITERGGSEADPRQLKGVVVEARETGFGDNSLTNPSTPNAGQTTLNTELSQADDDSSRRCVATAMGHVSRIWHVEFVEPRPDAPDIVPIYSFGEDTTAQKWHLTFTPHSQASSAAEGITEKIMPNGKLTNKTIFRNHTGKHLWAKAVLEAEHGSILIATGGSDGKITLVHDENVASSPSESAGSNSWEREYSLEDLTQAFPKLPEPTPVAVSVPESEAAEVEAVGADTPAKPKKKAKPPKVAKESFQRYAFASEDKVVVVSNRGRVLVGTFTKGLQWEQLNLPENIRQSIAGYSIVQACSTTSTVYLGTGRGEIYAYSERTSSTLQLVTTFKGKIADLICLENADKESSVATSQLLVTVLGSSSATLLSIDESSTAQKTSSVPLEPGFIITAAGFAGQYLTLGSRNGFISILGWDEKTSSYATHFSFREKSKDAITSLICIPQRPSSTKNYLLATCRDGKYRIYEILSSSSSSSSEPATLSKDPVVLLQETTPPFGPLIERAWFVYNTTTKTTELMLCGFRSTHAVLWNATQQREVAIIECGGPHRSFAFTILQQSQQPDGFRFVFTKASQMHVFSQVKSQAQTVKPGSHGREIRAVSCSGKYIATGAEDTNIRIHEYIPPSPSSRREGAFRCVATIEKHATGIQTLRWYENEYLCSSGGNEEFFVWRVNRIDSDVCPLGIVCEAVFKDKSEIGDLRIMDFDIEPLKDDQEKSEERKGELRFCITMALSNSTVQSYVYSRSGGFELLGRRRYTGACLMQLRHLGFSAGSGHPDAKTLEPHVITASTDGHLAVFVGVDSTLVVEPVLREETGGDEHLVPESGGKLITRLHQSGLKSLDVLKVDDETASDAPASISYLVVTGGDDNAIGMMHLSYSLHPTSKENSNTGGYKVMSKMILRSAHAAAVTGIGIVRLENSGRDAIIVSTGNDQRVKTWRLVNWRGQKGGGVTRLLLIADEYSGVADSGDLEIMDSICEDNGWTSRFLVGGVGMEVWEV